MLQGPRAGGGCAASFSAVGTGVNAESSADRARLIIQLDIGPAVLKYVGRTVQPLIQPARTGQIPEILVLMREYYELDRILFDAAVAPQRLEELLSDERMGRVWVATDEGRIVGYVAITHGFGLEHGRNATIDEFYVQPSCRRQGLGREMLAVVEAHARACGIQSLHAEAETRNAQALAFWARMGFQRYARNPLVKMLP